MTEVEATQNLLKMKFSQIDGLEDPTIKKKPCAVVKKTPVYGYFFSRTFQYLATK